MNRKLIPAALFLLLATTSITAAADQVSPYGSALASYYDGDYAQAEKTLSVLIDEGTEDPRVYYFRGLARYSLKKTDDAKSDFADGARLEATGRSLVNVSRALERVQGRARLLIEDYRTKSRRRSASGPASRQRNHAIREIYADARAAWFRGDAATARKLLDPVIEQGTNDPRLYYFRGLALDKLGESAAARSDFTRAVALETGFDRRIDVDRALERIQGAPRRTLETHRQEALNIVRVQEAERRRRLIAEVRARNAARSGLVVQPATPRPGTAPGASVATNTHTTTPATTPMPGTPTTPGTTATPSVNTPRATVGSAASINLAWLPPETAVVIRISPREIWQSEFARQFHDVAEVKQALAMMQAEIKLSPVDIETITIGGPSPDPAAAAVLAGPAALAGPGALSGADFGKEMVVVARTRLPFDPSVVEGRDEFERADHGGKSYFRPTSETGDEAPSIYIADSRTVVLALEPALQKAIDQGPQTDPRPEFDFLDTSKQFIIGFVPDDPAMLTAEMNVDEDTGSKALNRLGKAAKDNLLGLALSIGVQDSIQIEASFPPATAGLGDSLLRTVRSSAKTEVFAFSLTITQNTMQRIVASAEELGEQIMGAVMQQMIAGGPGNPGAPGNPNIPVVPPNAQPGNNPPAEPPMATRPAGNLTIASAAQISMKTEFDFDKNEQKPKAIELLLDMTGDDAARAAGYGFIELTTAKDNNGTDLVQRVQKASPFSDAPGFIVINRNDFFVKHPDNGCRLVVAFEPPATAPTHIAQAEGTLKLKTVDESQDIVIDDIKSLVGMNIQNDALEAAGYQFKLEETEEDQGDEKVKQWTLTWVNADASKVDELQAGGGEGPQKPDIVDADGNVIMAFNARNFA